MLKKSEQRNAKRYRLEMPAEIRVMDSESEAAVSFNFKTKDISSSGACLEGPSQVEEGTEMEIFLEIPLEKLRSVTSRVAKVKLNGIVVRVSNSGTALSFRGPGDFQYLESDRRIDDVQEDLTPIEKRILEKIEEGSSNRQMAEELQISEKAVKTHLNNVFPKIHAKGRLQAAIWARHNL